MSTGSVNKPNRTPIFIVGGVLGCLLLCVCIVLAGAGLFIIVGRSTTVAEVTPFPTSQTNLLPPSQRNPTPLPTSSSIDFSTYTGSGAPFSIQYPSDWDVEDQEAAQNSVVFISPSKTAS